MSIALAHPEGKPDMTPLGMTRRATDVAEAKSGSREPITKPLIDTEQLNRLYHAIYDGPEESPPWNTALGLLRVALGASHVVLILRPPSKQDLGAIINSGSLSVQDAESYRTQFFALDPFVKLVEGEVVTAEELIGKRWLTSQIYREHLRPLDIRHILGADIYTSEGVECRLRITRPHSAGSFTLRDKELCRLLLPHLKRSIQIHAKFDVLRCEKHLLAGSVDRMLLGVVILSRTGQVLEVNKEAGRIFGENDGVLLVGRRLSASVAFEEKELRLMIKDILTADDAIRPQVVPGMLVSRPSGRMSISVLIRKMYPLSSPNSTEAPGAVIYMRDPNAMPSKSSTEMLRHLFNLTPTETSLTALLVDGMTLDEASAHMSIRRNTARSHLRSIFSKTGVARQTTLVHHFLNSIAIIG